MQSASRRDVILDGWTTFESPADALLSVLFVMLYYTGPGMFKSYITIRSTNAWTHVWAYHALTPLDRSAVRR